MLYYDQILGKEGEKIAADFLKAHGWKIIDTNFRSRFGEIDIIARNEEEIIFVEVKTRAQKRYGMPAEAITVQKKKHLYRTAEYYVMKNHFENKPIRFDVIEVFKEKDKVFINQISNVIF